MINKKAESAPLPPGAKPMPAPSGGTSSQPSPGRVSKRSVDKEEQGRVMRMQQIMSELAKAIDQNPGVYASKTNAKNETALSAAIRNTGNNTSTPFDGVWGGKTTSALNQIAQNATNKDGELIAKINPGQHYSKVTKDQVIKAADDNVQAIINLMKAVGFGGLVPAGLASSSGKVYDMVPRDLTKSNLDPRQGKGKNAVTPEHLDNLWTFYAFAEELLGLNKSAGNPEILKKIANHINNSNIVRLAETPEERMIRETPGTPDANDPNYKTPDAAPEYKAPAETGELQAAVEKGDVGATGLAREDKKAPTADEVKLDEEVPQFGTLTVTAFSKVIQWFLDRSYLVYKLSNMNVKRKASKPDGTPWTDKDLTLATEYVRAMRALSSNWKSQAKEHVKGKRPDQAFVDPMLLNGGKGSIDYDGGGSSDSRVVLDEDGRDGRDGRGRRHEGLGRGDSGDIDSEQIQMVRKYPNGPLEKRMDLEDLTSLIDFGQEPISKLFKVMNGKRIGMSILENASPGSIARKYNKPNSGVSPKGFAQLFPRALRRTLKSILRNWSEAARNAGLSGVEDTIDKQHRVLDRWESILDELETEADAWETDMIAKN